MPAARGEAGLLLESRRVVSRLASPLRRGGDRTGGAPEARGPWPPRGLQRLVGRGPAALELVLCAAAFGLLLGVAAPGEGHPSGAEPGAGQLGLGWVRYRAWSSRRLSDDVVEPGIGLDADGYSPEANMTDVNATTTTTTMNAMTMQGGRENSKADDGATLEALFLYWACLSPFYVVVFLIFHRFFPLVITFYTTPKAGRMRVPLDVPETMFGWVKVAATVSNMDGLWRVIGLDEMLMLEFPGLCLRISLYVGAPMVLITCPINYYVNQGGDDLDFLSRLGTANLGHSDNPLFWAHAVIVWIVVVIVCWLISDAEAKFVEQRFEWLKWLPEPRATTLMIENIPVEYRSDAKLREIFSETLSHDVVKNAYTVKDTRRLQRLIAKRESMAQQRRKASFERAKGGIEDRALLRAVQEGAEELEAELEATAEGYGAEAEAHLDREILAERRRVAQEAEKVGGVNTSTGFVTFDSQSSVAAAWSARITPRRDEFIMSVPPNPHHVNYGLLSKDPTNQEFLTALGYVCIYLIFFFYTSVVTTIVTLGAWLELLERHGWLRINMHALLPTLAFQLCVGFLPTIFRFIFESFWACPSEPYVQRLLYRWYFWFLYVFVLFISVIGGNPIEKARELSEEPVMIPSKIAESLPKVSNWFVTLIILQVSNHFLSLTRYVQVIKYMVFRTMYRTKDAKIMSEPEDQDYFGVGSRSARWINSMLIGLVFCQIQPTLLIFVAINFVVCKVVYGYLLVFSQSRKADRGGTIYQDQLWHMQIGLATYIVVMTGYLANRSKAITISMPFVGEFPMSASIISFSSMIYLVRCSYRLANIDCSVLPRRLVPKHAQLDKHDSTVSYIQSELLENKHADAADDDWLCEASQTVMRFDSAKMHRPIVSDECR